MVIHPHEDHDCYPYNSPLASAVSNARSVPTPVLCSAMCNYCGVASSASKPLQLPAGVELNTANDNRPAACQRRRPAECGKADETSHARRASPECQQNGVQVARFFTSAEIDSRQTGLSHATFIINDDVQRHSAGGRISHCPSQILAGRHAVKPAWQVHPSPPVSR
jgi:hypothetical protein